MTRHNTQTNNTNDCGNIPIDGCPPGEVWNSWPTCQCVNQNLCSPPLGGCPGGSFWKDSPACRCVKSLPYEEELPVIDPGPSFCPTPFVPYYIDSDGDGLYDVNILNSGSPTGCEGSVDCGHVCAMVCESHFGSYFYNGVQVGFQDPPMYNGFPCVPETSVDLDPLYPASGCTDANACNYDATATQDDGNCEYLSCDDGCGPHQPGPSGCDETCGSTLVYDVCGVCGGYGPDIDCEDGTFVCDDDDDCPEFEIPSIYIEGDDGGLPFRNFVGFTLPMRDTLVCASTIPPGISDDECIGAEVGTLCGDWDAGVCHYYDTTNVMTNSFFQSDPDLIEDGSDLPTLQSFVDGDKLVTNYKNEDGTLILGQVGYNEQIDGTWLGNIKFLEPGRGYKLYTTNSGWIKWRFEE